MFHHSSVEGFYEQFRDVNVSEDRIAELEKFLKQEHEDHCETDEACRKIAEKFLTHSEVYGDGYQVPLEEVFRMVVERLSEPRKESL